MSDRLPSFRSVRSGKRILDRIRSSKTYDESNRYILIFTRSEEMIGALNNCLHEYCERCGGRVFVLTDRDEKRDQWGAAKVVRMRRRDLQSLGRYVALFADRMVYNVTFPFVFVTEGRPMAATATELVQNGEFTMDDYVRHGLLGL